MVYIYYSTTSQRIILFIIYPLKLICLIFFFQAEDGIRDGHVTGVQTCLFRSRYALGSERSGLVWEQQGSVRTYGEREGLAMTMRAGEVYEHPFERLVVRVGTAESDGRELVADLYVRADAPGVPRHIHPTMAETFTVVRGKVSA